MVEVLVNVPFNDKYTGELYVANSKMVIKKERATEILNFDKSLITVLKEVEEKAEAKTKAK